MIASDVIIQFLAENGIDRIFGIPGYANSPLLYSTLGFPGVKPVLTRHEANAAWMAYGYAQISGKWGVCTGTSGAGTTNILSAVTAAYYNSVPVLVLTGQVERAKFGKGGFQELTGSGARSASAVRLFESVTKLSATVQTPEQLSGLLGEALMAMTTGRPGPVHLSLPVDVLKAEGARLEQGAARPAARRLTSGELEAVVDLLRSAKAPLVIIGRGCRGAKAAVHELVRHLRLPYCTTLQGRSAVPEDEFGFLGVVGVAGSPSCNAYVAEACDLILAIGTSLGEFTTGGYAEAFCRPGRLVHIDIDPREFGKSVQPRLAVLADAGEFSRALLAGVPASTGHAGAGWAPYLAGDRRVPVPRAHDVEGRVSPMEIMELVEEFAPADAIVLADSGNNAVWAAHYLRLGPRQDFLIDINTGCMGSGVVAAIGAKMAAPGRQVLAICGDGGFMMNGVDVATAAEHELPIVWLVMNDFKLGMVDQGYRGKYGGSVACDFRQADIAAMARAYGASAAVVHSREELRAALAGIATLKGPLVLDVRFNDRYLPSVYARVNATPEDRAFAASARAANFKGKNQT